MNNSESVILKIEDLKSLIRDIVAEVLAQYNEEDIQDDFLNIQQAAAFVNLAVATLYEKTSEKSIPHYKQGKKIMFKKEELIRWVESKKINVSIKKNEPLKKSIKPGRLGRYL